MRTATFRSLVADAEDTVMVVARFLALLELFREAAVAFDQVTPLGELTIRWTGAEEGELDVHDEFDDDAAAAAGGIELDDQPVAGDTAVGHGGHDGTSTDSEPAAAEPSTGEGGA
jgi:segregation and condensation protein A